MSDTQQTEVYRVEDSDGETLPGGEYEDPNRALDRRAREMAEHPDGDGVTVETYSKGSI